MRVFGIYPEGTCPETAICTGGDWWRERRTWTARPWFRLSIGTDRLQLRVEHDYPRRFTIRVAPLYWKTGEKMTGKRRRVTTDRSWMRLLSCPVRRESTNITFRPQPHVTQVGAPAAYTA